MNFLKSSAFLVLVSVAPLANGADFALRDHDTVVFLGDSITAARGYTKLAEEYTLLRFPERRVRFVNAGQGGDTASGALTRLDRDVFSRGATVVTVAFGVNDIGWGMKADAEHKQRYLDGIRGIVKACQKHKARVFICSPAITAEDPDRAEKGFLQSMTDEGMALARSLGAESIDLQRGMREIQRHILEANKQESDPKKKTSLHLDDGVHLTDLGQLAMGYVLLKGLGAPADVSSLVIDAQAKSVVSAVGCRASDLRRIKNGLEFVRQDDGLPLNLGILGGLNFRFIPIPDNLNRYMLAVRNLAPGEYDIRVQDRVIGRATAEQLREGLNISSMTTNGWEPGGPWDAQAAVIKELTEARDKICAGDSLRRQYLVSHPQSARLKKETLDIDQQIVQLQRDTARPYPFHFEIQKRPLPSHPTDAKGSP
jgi:lysophospholipase L1-like esterase